MNPKEKNKAVKMLTIGKIIMALVFGAIPLVIAVAIMTYGDVGEQKMAVVILVLLMPFMALFGYHVMD